MKVKSSVKVKQKKFLRFASTVNIRTIENLHKRSLFKYDIKFLHRATNVDYMYSGGFHEAIAPVLVMAQIFAVMPVINIKSKNPDDIYFKWKSFRTIYSIVVFWVLLTYLCITTYWSLFDGKIEFIKFVPVIFYGSNTYIVLVFIILARKWPDLIRQWTKVEGYLPKYNSIKEKGKLALQIKIITITIMSLSLTEHLLSIITNLPISVNCTRDRNIVKDYFEVEYQQLFHLVKFNAWYAVGVKIVNLLGTFSWSYMDLFVMLIAIGLSSRFHQINVCLAKVKGKQMPESYWAEQRFNYRQLVNLCSRVDDAIAQITIVSFSNNLYFICVQLLNSLKKKSSFSKAQDPSMAHGIYFWFSLLYLIGRTLAVSLYSANINSESKKPVDVIRAIPRESWCLEAKRFSEEVTNDTVALSGMKFFYLTRGLVLSVAGTIVTYELVLLQFHEDEKPESNDDYVC